MGFNRGAGCLLRVNGRFVSAKHARKIYMHKSRQVGNVATLMELPEDPCGMDGVYVDASYNPETWEAALAAVRVERGLVIESVSSYVTVVSSNYAEIEAIDFALSKFPGERVFSDSTSAAAERGVTWIPREMNRHAHQLAAMQVRWRKQQEPDEGTETAEGERCEPVPSEGLAGG